MSKTLDELMNEYDIDLEVKEVPVQHDTFTGGDNCCWQITVASRGKSAIGYIYSGPSALWNEPPFDETLPLHDLLDASYDAQYRDADQCADETGYSRDSEEWQIYHDLYPYAVECRSVLEAVFTPEQVEALEQAAGLY